MSPPPQLLVANCNRICGHFGLEFTRWKMIEGWEKLNVWYSLMDLLSLLGIALFQNLYLVFFPRSNFQPQMWKCFLMLGQTFWTSLRASGRWQHLVHVSPWITCNHLVASWGGDHPENCPAVTFKLSEHQSRTTSGGAGHFLDCEPCQQQQQKTSNVAKNVPSLFFLPFQANCVICPQKKMQVTITHVSQSVDAVTWLGAGMSVSRWAIQLFPVTHPPAYQPLLGPLWFCVPDCALVLKIWRF